jgi:hypothetical protein
MEFTFGNWATKRLVKIEGQTLSVMRKNGDVIKSWHINEIYGISYTPPAMMRDGTLGFADNYSDSLVTTWTTVATWPGSLTVTQSDKDSATQIIDWFDENRNKELTQSPFELEAKTSGSYLALDKETIIIRHTGFINQVSRGGMQGEKRIPLRSVLSVQFKNATASMAGYIQFETAGGSQQAARGGLFEAAGDENTVVFAKAEQEAFEKFRDRVNELLGSGLSIATSISSADELAKFAKLRDEGVISEEEFVAKKKQILGL